MRAQAYVLELICENADAEVRLNDWIAYHAFDARRRAAQVKLNPWLLEGRNQLTATLSPFNEDVEFIVRLYKTEHGTHCTDDKELLAFAWTRDEAPLDNQGAPTMVFHHDFLMTKAFGPWSWEQAQAYLPSDRPRIEALVTQLHAAISNRQVDVVMSALSTKLEEMARALGLDVDVFTSAQREVLAEILEDGALRVDPLDVTRLTLRPSAGGRLVDILDEQGDPAPLKLWVGDMPSHLGLEVSHIAGHWRVVR